MAGKIGASSGFTLIELLVVIMVIGILTALAIPQYYKTLERDRAAEGIDLLYNIKGAQDRYLAKYGVFCNSICNGLDFTSPTMNYFSGVPAFTAGSAGGRSWKLVLTRNDAPMPYGAYHLSYDIEPGAAPLLTCDNAACAKDLLPNQN